MCSCCEDEYYEVSCSVEERIDRELWESNEKERRDRDILNDLRQRNYQQVYSSKTSKVFGLPGLQFEFEEGRIEPLDLLSEDEELLLTEEQRQLLHERRLKILRRMIPPRSPRTNRKRKGEKRMILSSSSDD
ncbi:uncharacterized protein LOC132698461 isoform X3 [Cylas formicarius]|uniref:uncharacterized protein LOC132698461 isoform X3 n=1 Tax=Cylas formicarius TaxID=197179 RepID=UPI0029587D64|nr:uncharacterized protein LOC132698461 isoform X3 [Cylas formicarius]